MRNKVIEEAKNLINGERANDYGDATSCFRRIAWMWSSYLNCQITPEDVAMMMVLLKIARHKNGQGVMDNFVDIIGYAALGAEAHKGEMLREQNGG